jgi:hypothetical protein
MTGGGALAAVLLLGVGVALGIAGLFFDYLGGSSLAAQPENLVPHVIYLATWTAGGVLIALGGARLRVGALLATGLSIVTLGLFLSDAGTPIAGGAHLAGAGLVLSLLGWLACAAGSVLAFLIRPRRASGIAPSSARTAELAPDPATLPVPEAGTYAAAGPVPETRPAERHGRLISLGWPRGAALGPAVLLVLAGIGAAIAFVPSWDSFTLRTAAGQVQTIAEGNAFSNPGAVIAGDVVTMVALIAVVIAAALWRPARYGAVLLAGAIIPMAAQAISALIQVGEPVSPSQFGFSPAQASGLGLTISAGLTPSFWIYSVLIVVLLVSCAWMLFIPLTSPAAPAPAGPRLADDADLQVPIWHVARADAYDQTAARAPETDDEFDSYEEFSTDNPSASTPKPDHPA